MRITIEYDSCWQTKFLGGEHDAPISKKTNPRKFVATTTTKGDKPAPITKNTVMGILCRLIGDQRKLFQARSSENYYFSEIEETISFAIKKNVATNQELIYLTNKSEDRCGQTNFLGVLSSDNPWFFSDIAPRLWSVLFFNQHELLNFILSSETPRSITVDCSPKNLIARLRLLTDSKSSIGAIWKTKERLLAEKQERVERAINKLADFEEKSKKTPPKSKIQHERKIAKRVELNTVITNLNNELERIKVDSEISKFDDLLHASINFFAKKYPDCLYWENRSVYPSRIYTSALYLQAERLVGSGCNFDFAISKSGNNKGEIVIKGFSKNSKANHGFNGIRDWLNPMAGGRKKAVGTPCSIQKQSGQLEITIDVDRKKANELISMIENAGVSSFYLGKKGLAYVSRIRP